MNERRLGPGSWWGHGFVWWGTLNIVKGCTITVTTEHPGYVIKRDTTWQSEAMRYFEEIPIPKFDAKLKEAAAAPTLDQANKLYQEAEAIIAADFPSIPMWSYATTDHRLVDPDLPPALIKRVKGQMWLAPPVYVLAIGMAYVNLWISFLIFAALQIHYMRPGQIDRHAKPGH